MSQHSLDLTIPAIVTPGTSSTSLTVCGRGFPLVSGRKRKLVLDTRRTQPNTSGGRPGSMAPRSTINGAKELPILLTNSRKLKPKFLKILIKYHQVNLMILTSPGGGWKQFRNESLDHVVISHEQ